MEFATVTSPHVPLPNSVTRVMTQVLLALVPGLIAMVWFFGWGVLVIVLITTVAAVCATALVLR